MSRIQLLLITLTVFFSACATVDQQGTIAELRNRSVDLEDAQFTEGLDKAMMSYQRFLQENPKSELAPEAIRRLADLKVEKEYGTFTEQDESVDANKNLPAHQTEMVAGIAPIKLPDSPAGESDEDFEERATENQVLPQSDSTPESANEGPVDLQKAGPLEAIALYQKLLEEYPFYDRNDQVLYQMSRAYEELGRVEDAMDVMNRLVREYPDSRYIDEVQFRRGEYFFTRRQYLDAEDAYMAIERMGAQSAFYPFALYKLGWTFYKQELYEDALHNFVALLDYKVSIGYDFDQTEDEPERKRIEDTFRVVSLSFSYLGGADIVAEYFAQNGERSYEDLVYSNLGEYYFDKRRYNDANETYSAFVERYPFHRQAPHFQMRIIEINIAGGFPSLVIDSKKQFARSYGLQAEYWQYFDPDENPDVLDYLKINLTDLANHYHALYQNPEMKDEKPVNFNEALHWYREFLASFPMDSESPTINYQLADLLLENQTFDQAAMEYEKTAYSYPEHDKASTAGYAAVYAYREHLKTVSEDNQDSIRYEIVRSSLQFADTFPEHEKAAVVLGAAVDDLYDLQEYQQAIVNAHHLVESFPKADLNVQHSAWIVIGHASYELQQYPEAELAYQTVLNMLPKDDARREGLVDNLAASIYQQGTAANELEDYRAAAEHFLRISSVAPTSAIRATAEYDAAAALIHLQDWNAAVSVLLGFRNNFPDHELQPEVTKKIAYVYQEDGQLALAAQEYERIETETSDDEVRREALLTAADLYEAAGDSEHTLAVYQRYVAYFPVPVELNLETRHKISLLLLSKNSHEDYLQELETIVAIDAAAGESRTSRTRYLASKAGLVLAERSYDQFVDIRLVKPIDVNLRKKQAMMKMATKQFNQLLEYEVGEVTAAATYYLAEIYAHFSKALVESERPDNLSPLELEQYELAIEEQAYPFEERAIEVHESNLELISLGIYNSWIDKSLERLAQFMPARYARKELESPIMVSPENYTYTTGKSVLVTESSTALPAMTDFQAEVVATNKPDTLNNAVDNLGESQQEVRQDLQDEFTAETSEPITRQEEK